MNAAVAPADAPATRADADRSRFPATLGGQFRRNLHLYLLGFVLLAVQQLAMAKRDFLVKAAVDAVDAEQPGPAAHAAIVMLLVSIGAAGVRILSRITVFGAGRNVEYELRAVLLDRLHRLGPAFFRRMPTGEIMSRATNDLTQVRLLLGFGVLNVLASGFAFASALYVMLAISPKLTACAVATLPITLFVTRSLSVRMFSANREAQEAIGSMSDRVLASLAGVRVVRAFALEASEFAAFEKVNQNLLEKGLRLARIRGGMTPLIGTINAAGLVVVFWYGGSLVLTGEMSKGGFVSFWMALLRLTWPMIAVGFVTAIVQRGRAGYERLRGILEAVPDLVDGPRPAPAGVRGDLRVEHLTFRHGDRKVVDDVSFHVPAGGSLAIVGRTGSGKSTLATLLPRLMPTPRGTVFLDGEDVCDLPLRAVRAAIGYAQQDAFLFSTTVARNVGFALDDPDAPEATTTLRQAASEASVLEEIETLPEGFDTVVGERGVQLSGGQRQRVALARALVREPPILVLDDPLSAVDAKTEERILEAIERQAARRTVVLITHRVAAARRCDRVVVLEEGRVAEEGTADELLARGGLFAAFAEEQRLEADLAGDEAPPAEAAS